MCIFNFKPKSFNIKRERGFTFVEVMLVMVLISFLYIVTMKVIQHNLDQKVPVYVYNLYKNLDNESKLLTKKLLEDANGEGSSESGTSGSGGGASANQKSIEEVLKKMDAKSYCEAFANDANLIGNADCENSINNLETGEAENKNATYTCERTYSFNVNDDGTYKETFTPSYDANLTQCKDNENFDDNISCNAKPTEKIANLMLDNTQNYHTYSCKKDQTKDNNETTQDVVAFDIDDTKPDISKSLKTTNNIHLNFVTLKPGNNQYSITYNLAANVNQDAICPKPTLVLSNPNCEANAYTCIRGSATFTQNPNGSPLSSCYKAGQNTPKNQICTAESGYYVLHTLQLTHTYSLTCNEQNVTSKISSWGSYCEYNSGNETISSGVKFYNTRDSESGGGDVNTSYKIINSYGNSCQDYINTSKKLSQVNYDNYFNRWQSGNYHVFTIVAQTFNYANATEHGNYYTKWNAFFNTQENGKYIFAKATKAAIKPDNPLEEGSVETTLDKTSSNINDYLAHFIYASIDIPFAKGTIGKNIFVFEQFGSKIIPVGYLANNQNTPLKFNVITRNPNSFKIEKVNEKPLTFCEAMKYTGDKFSQYCGCVDTDNKDTANKIVTQYPKMASCDNKFGCIIKPVQPSQVTPKFKLF